LGYQRSSKKVKNKFSGERIQQLAVNVNFRFDLCGKKSQKYAIGSGGCTWVSRNGMNAYWLASPLVSQWCSALDLSLENLPLSLSLSRWVAIWCHRIRNEPSQTKISRLLYAIA